MINKILFFYYENKQTNKRAPKDFFRTSLLCLDLSLHSKKKSDGKLMLNNEGKHLKHKSSIKLCICAFIPLDFNCSDLFNMYMMLNVCSVRIFSCYKNLNRNYNNFQTNSFPFQRFKHFPFSFIII